MTELVTMSEYKTFASISGDKLDARLEPMLTVATQVVLNYIGKYLQGDLGSVDVFTRVGKTTYYVDIVGAKIISIMLTSRASGEVSTPEYVIDGDAVILLEAPTVDYDTLTIGLLGSTNTVTEDIKQAIMMLTQYYYKGEYNRTQVAAGGSQIDYAESKSIPNSIRALLDFYRVL
jgi:hypothetical protein